MATSIIPNPNPSRTLKYMDLTDTHPVNVRSKSGNKIDISNFVSAVPIDNGCAVIVSMNSGVLYAELREYNNPANTVSGSHTVRIWYWG